jgi:hypothetical protein
MLKNQGHEIRKKLSMLRKTIAWEGMAVSADDAVRQR